MEKTVRIALLLFVALVLAGTGGYRIIEGWGWIDSLYMTIISLTTVGFGEVHELSAPGRIFTSVLIVLGVSTLAYAVTKTTEAIIERGIFRESRLTREIKRMREHVVIAGYGRMGVVVARELKARAIPFVVIEKDPAALDSLQSQGYIYVKGDATDDNALIRSGIEKAKALATVLPNDSDNLFITLTARSLNENLVIVARSSYPKNTAKIMAAGANRVLNPYLSGGRLITRQLLHPSVTEFFEIVGQWQETDISLEEVQLSAGSSLIDLKLREAPIRSEMDIIVVGIRGAEGAMQFNPDPDLLLQEGDTLVVLGHRENLRRLERLSQG